MLHLNINSVFCKFFNINLILNLNLYDIVFIQESKLGVETPDALISNSFYNLLRRDRIAGGGGLLVYTKKAYKLSDVFIDPTFETIMFSIIFDKKKKSKQIFISSYNPKFAYSVKYLAYLENLISNIKKQKNGSYKCNIILRFEP